MLSEPEFSTGQKPGSVLRVALARLPDAAAQGPQPGPAEPRPQAAGQGSRALRNTALVLAARFLSRALALFTVVLTIHHLGAGRFGRFSLLVTVASIVTVLIDLGFNSLYPREAARHPGEMSRYLGNLVTLRLVMGLVAFAVLALALLPYGLDYLAVPGFLMLLLQSYSGLLRQTFYASQRVGFEAVGIVVEAIVLLALTLAGIAAGAHEAYFVWAYAAMWGVSCAYIVAVLQVTGLARLRPRFEWGLMRSWLRQSLPFAMTFVITTVYFKSDQPILGLFRPNAEVGLYAAAYKPFEALLFIPVSMLNVVYPVLSVFHRESRDRLRPGIERFYKLLLLVGWPLTVGTVVLAPGFARLLAYPESAPALAILGGGIVLMFVNNAFIGALNSIDRQAAFTGASIVSMVVNVGLNLVMIPIWGYIGASISTVLTEAVLLSVSWWLVRRHLFALPALHLSWRILVAGLLMGLVIAPFRAGGPYWAVAAIPAGAVVYAVAVFLIRALDPGELDLFRRAVRP